MGMVEGGVVCVCCVWGLVCCWGEGDDDGDGGGGDGSVEYG